MATLRSRADVRDKSGMGRVEEEDKNEFGWILLSLPKSADKTLKTFRREFIQMDSFRLDLLISFMASACRCWGWGG